MKRLDFLLIFAAAAILLVPVFRNTAHQSLRADTDYDSNLPIYTYVLDYIHAYHVLPQTNTLVGKGISVLGDPLSALYNPMFSIPIYILGVDDGLKVVFLLSVLLSGVSMLTLLSSYGFEGLARVLGVLLYELSGALSARIAAGHIEKILSYPLQPFFYLFTLKERMSWTDRMGAAAALALIFFSGDIYGMWLLGIMFIATRGFWFMHRKAWRDEVMNLVLVAGIFLLGISVKLFYLLKDVYPYFSRFSAVNYLSGSIHYFLVPFAYFMPIQAMFYDRPTIQRILGFHFNWYEYYAFITPLPFLFLLYLPKVLKEKITQLTIVLLLVGSMYVALGYPYSFFYWLFKLVPPLEVFRVPQRMIMVMTPLVILLLVTCAASWFKFASLKWMQAGLIISMFAVGWTLIISRQTILKSYEPVRQTESSVAGELRARDPSGYFAVSFVCCMQRPLTDNHIPILNYYYGWRTKETPSFITADGEAYNYDMLTSVRPKYIITKKGLDMSKYAYSPFFNIGIIEVWTTDYVTISPTI